jgi:protocatechuate 3,4-dioxygenase beta subunit
VHGIVVDARGAPLAGANVALGARVWHADVATTLLPWPGAYDGFTTVTDDRGGFRFEVVPPQNAPQKLVVDGGAFVAVHERSFGARSSESIAALAAGVVDLGVIQLTDTGSISGRVVDTNGAPIEGAPVDVGPTSGTTYSRGTKSAADGSFLMTSVPPGTCAVDARSERYKSASVDGLVVEAGRELRGVELVLTNASTIEGVVRDTSGAPIFDARLTSWPNDEGRVAQARSREDGTFVLYLPQDGPHTLEAKCEGFESWGDQHDRGVLYDSGTRDLVIVMAAMEPLTIRVVDAESGEPLERFGVTVMSNMGAASTNRTSSSPRATKSTDHPGGSAAIFAKPGVDALDVSADGYVLARFQVEEPTGPDFVQVVRLVPTGRVIGRALRNGVPVADARVVLVRARPESADELREILGEPAQSEATWHRIEGALREARTDADGRFSVEVTENGPARLTVDVGAGATLVHVLGLLRANATHDVGDLEAVAPGRIEGTVITSVGVDRSGLVVQLDHGQDGREALVDASGRFVFEELPPGGHHVRLEGRRGLLATDPGRAIEVASGATANIEIDARGLTLGHVVLTLAADGIPLDQLRVTVLSSDGSVNAEFGTPDAQGRVRGDVRTGIALYPSVWTPLGYMRLTDQTFTAEPLTTTEATVRVDFGAIEIVLPKDLVMPASATLTLSATSVDRPGLEQNVWLTFIGGAPMAEVGSDVRLDGLRLHIGQLLVGTWTLGVGIEDPTAPMESYQREDGRTAKRRPTLHSSSHTVTIEAGRASEVVLP